MLFRARRFFTSSPSPVVARATDAFKMQVARAEARRKSQAGLLNFDYSTATDSTILEWHNLYTTEKAAIQYRQNLLKFGKMALKQIKQNRIPVDSKLTIGLPVELLAPIVADDEIVRWFSNVVANFKESDTSALPEFEAANSKLTVKQSARRDKLLEYFQEHAPDLHVQDLSLPVMQTLKKQIQQDAVDQRKAERLAKKEAVDSDKYYQRLNNARLTAGRQHKRGKITAFDYREADDETILEWFENFKAERKRTKY